MKQTKTKSVVVLRNHDHRHGKQFLIDWMNKTLGVWTCEKIDDLTTGVPYMQILKKYFGLKLTATKGDTNLERTKNWELVRRSLSKLGIDNVVNIPRLTCCLFKDHLDFLRWFKKWLDANNGGEVKKMTSSGVVTSVLSPKHRRQHIL